MIQILDPRDVSDKELAKLRDLVEQLPEGELREFLGYVYESFRRARQDYGRVGAQLKAGQPVILMTTS